MTNLRPTYFFPVAIVLLPAHPSLQQPLALLGLPSIFVALLMLLPTLWLLLAGRHRFNKDHLLVLLCVIAYISWMILRSIASPALGAEWFNSSIRGLLLLLPMALLAAWVAAQQPFTALLMISGLGLMALLHYAFLFWVGGDVQGGSGFRALASDGEQHNYQSTAFYLGMAATFLTGYLAVCKRRWLLLVLPAIAVVMIAIATVGARASLVALLGSLLMTLLLFNPARALKIGLIGSVAVCAFVVFFNGDVILEALTSQLVSLDRIVILLDGGDSSSRIYLFAAALMLWLDSAWYLIIGAGIGAYPVFINKFESGWYPHNFLLETLAEGGLVGLLPIIALACLVIFKVINLRRQGVDTAAAGLLAGVLYAVISYQFMGGVQVLWVPAFFVFVFMFARFNSHQAGG